MKNELELVICNFFHECDKITCYHRKPHSREIGAMCDSICRSQKNKGNFHCKKHSTVIRKEKIKKLNKL